MDDKNLSKSMATGFGLSKRGISVGKSWMHCAKNKEHGSICQALQQLGLDYDILKFLVYPWNNAVIKVCTLKRWKTAKDSLMYVCSDWRFYAFLLRIFPVYGSLVIVYS